MRVLWVTNMFWEEGAPLPRGIFVAQQWHALLATGSVDLELELVAQQRGRLDYLLANRRVRARCARGFDLVHVHYGLTALSTLALPGSMPVVISLYGSDMNFAVQRTISKLAARRSVRRIFVARRLADHWPSSRNVVLPNGVDFSVCRPLPRDQARAELGLDARAPVVLFGAHPDNAVKGYDVFQEVLRRVRREHPDAQELVLTVPGQGYERVVQKLNAADCLAFTSRRGTEGSPTVIKEALAVGLPVVSVDVGDAREMLDGIQPGAVVDWPSASGPAPRQPSRESWLDTFAAAVGRVLATRERSDGRTRREFLRHDRIAQRTLDIYREVAGVRS